MPENSPDTDNLLSLAANGDSDACNQLLERHRAKLRHMAAIRLDPRLGQRVDPSDIVQETLIDAHRRLPEYLVERPLPFYPWLRGIAMNRMIDLHRRHVRSLRRSVTLESPQSIGQSPQHSDELVAQLSLTVSQPMQTLLDNEMRIRLQEGLKALPEMDREILILRHLEGLSVSDTAAILQVPEGTVKSRNSRALERLKHLLDDEIDGGP